MKVKADSYVETDPILIDLYAEKDAFNERFKTLDEMTAYLKEARRELKAAGVAFVKFPRSDKRSAA